MSKQPGSQTGYLESLVQFNKHVEESMNQLVDELTSGGEYRDRYNITISLNGKETTIEFHADAYVRLTSMIENEIREFKELKKYTYEDAHNQGHVQEITAQELRELAKYYYDHSDVIEYFDFDDIDVSIDFVRRVDKVDGVTNNTVDWEVK